MKFIWNWLTGLFTPRWRWILYSPQEDKIVFSLDNPDQALKLATYHGVIRPLLDHGWRMGHGRYPIPGTNAWIDCTTEAPLWTAPPASETPHDKTS